MSYQDGRRLIQLVGTHLKLNVWDVFIKGFWNSGAKATRRELNSNMKSQLSLDLTSYDTKLLNTRLSANDNLWVELQLDINSKISSFKNSDLLEVCMDGSCAGVNMPTTTIIPSANPTVSGLVVVLEVSMGVDEQLSENQEKILTSSILNAYNVSSSAVEIVTWLRYFRKYYYC